MNWSYLIIFICLGLAAFSVWKEFTRSNKRRLVWRIIAVLIAVAALACIALPVKYTGKATTLGKNDAVLLTAGFSTDSLNNYKTDSLFTVDAAIKNEYPKARLITLDRLNTVSPKIKQLHVLGYGLTNSELTQLDSIPLIFAGTPAPAGITAVNWNGQLKQGQTFTVQGSFSNTSGKIVRLILKGLNTDVDSLIVPARADTKFELKAVPKTIGRSVYQIVAITGKDTIASESLPVNIEPDKPLKILLLSAAPGFENRFLKNWLSENGFGVSARAAISKGKFSSEYVNMEQTPLEHLTPGLLSKFDVLIGDLSVLGALNGAEAAAVKQQVTQKGLGLIVNADTTLKGTSWLTNDFPIQKTGGKEQKPAALIVQGKKIVPKTLTAEQLFIIDHGGTQQLVTDDQNRILAGLTMAGSGKLILTTLGNTYTWMLAGSKSEYTAMWSLLIGKAAMTIPQAEIWQTAGIPTVNQPTDIKVETAANAGAWTIGDVPVAPQQSMLLPFQWQGTWWPSVPGWHSVKRAAGLPGWVYVNKAGSWNTISAISKSAATRKYAAALAKSVSVTKEIQRSAKITVPKIYFYIFLLAACTFLWLESKLSN